MTEVKLCGRGGAGETVLCDASPVHREPGQTLLGRGAVVARRASLGDAGARSKAVALHGGGWGEERRVSERESEQGIEERNSDKGDKRKGEGLRTAQIAEGWVRGTRREGTRKREPAKKRERTRESEIERGGAKECERKREEKEQKQASRSEMNRKDKSG
jgi:hypothetical protein